MYPQHSLTAVARSFCLKSDQEVVQERARLELNLRRFHPVGGRWALMGYAGTLALAAVSPLLAPTIPGLPGSISEAALLALFNLLFIAGMLHFATRELVREMFHLEPVPDGLDLRQLSKDSPMAIRFLGHLSTLRTARVLADVQAVKALA